MLYIIDIQWFIIGKNQIIVGFLLIDYFIEDNVHVRLLAVKFIKIAYEDAVRNKTDRYGVAEGTNTLNHWLLLPSQTNGYTIANVFNYGFYVREALRG